LNKFENKKEANEHIENSRDKINHVFCPLINKNCNKNCICYYDGTIEISGCGMTYIVKEAKCTNEMFTG